MLHAKPQKVIFDRFSRWLVTPLGPWMNLSSEMARYTWTRFLFWDVAGEALWVILYVMLGKILSDRVQALAEILGNLAWVIVGLVAAIILGWQLVRYLRPGLTLEASRKGRVIELPWRAAT